MLTCSSAGALIIPHMDHIFRFIEAVWRDRNHSKSVLRVAVGCLGDLGHCVEARGKQYFMLDWVRQFIAHCAKDKNNVTKENARFAKQVRQLSSLCVSVCGVCACGCVSVCDCAWCVRA